MILVIREFVFVVKYLFLIYIVNLYSYFRVSTGFLWVA